MTKELAREKLPFLFLLILAIFLRLFALDNIPGFLGDEAWGFAQIHAYLRGLPYTFDVPSGRMLNPIYAAYIFVFHSADPYFMRCTSVVIGIATLGIIWGLFKKLYGNQTAAAITLIAASYSLNIHYSRLAWDCCLIPPASVFLSYFILRKKTLWFLFCLAIGFSIHPTMIYFIFPAIIVYLNDLREEKRKIPWKIVVPSGVAGIAAAIFYINQKGLGLRFPYPAEVLRFAYGLLDFMTGTVISQEVGDNRIYFIAVFTIALGILIYFGRSLTKVEKSFFGGMILSFPALFLIMGAWPIIPGHERLILYAGFPLCLLIGLLTSRMAKGSFLSQLFATFYLCITILFLFNPVISSKIPTLQFRSGPEEPKYAAVHWILKEHKNSEQIRFIAERWGIYWNVYNYALVNYPGRIEMFQVGGQIGFDMNESIDTLEKFESTMTKGTYAIGFRGGHIDHIIYASTMKGNKYSRIGFKDYSGEDFIYVWVRE